MVHLAYLSYPFKNKADFDKKLDEEIKDIKEIQMENEGDQVESVQILEMCPFFHLIGKGFVQNA